MNDPEIVCGPVLRRVSRDTVTVFVALRSPRKVTLRVYSGETPGGAGTAAVQLGTAETTRLGERLHVVAVTSTVVEGGTPADPGADLRYQLFLGPPDGTAAPVPDGAAATTLFSPGVLLAGGELSPDPMGVVGYPAAGRRLPGFQVPPDDPAGLRVLHGGDRGPDAEGTDALATADQLVRDALTDPATGARPHLLVLTGDQVRTDDVSALLLALVRATAAKWGLAHDQLPGLADDEQPTVLGTHRRAALARRIGLRATDNHLLSFAEHVALHLLVLSDAAWPTMPTIEQVHPDLDWTRLPAELRAKIVAGSPYTAPAVIEGEVELFTAYLQARERLVAFRSSLHRARRAMANVAVLSTMGAHDAAPGWNASRASATKLLGDPAGKRVLVNALSANAVFHAWGNTPEQFTGTAPGAQLLTRLQTWLTPAVPAAAGADVDGLVGAPSAALARPATALTYSWALARDRWQLLFLDTQTNRGYPVAAGDPPAPLRDEGVVAALRLLPEPTATTVTLVVSAVPLVLPQRQELAHPTARPYSWSSHAASLHRTMTKLTTEKVPGGTAKKRTRRVLVLTGGQGHASAVRMRFSAKAPAYDSGTDAVEAVVGQFTAAPLRNTTALGRRLHVAGYDQHAVLAPWRDFVGWDQAHTSAATTQEPLPVGVRLTGADRTPAVWTIANRPQVAEVTPDLRVTVSPHWAWRADYLRSSLLATPRPEDLLEVAEQAGPWDDPDEPPPTPATAPKVWNLARYRYASHNHDHHRNWWAAGSELVGESALGDITFTAVPAPAPDAPATTPPVVPGAVATAHAAQWWWADDGRDTARRTRFDIGFEPGWGWYDDDRYDGRALRRGDFDARTGVQASYWGVRQNAGTHVADLRADLVELGFLIAGRDPAGKFDEHTQWAVREFQIYARQGKGAREKEYPGTKPSRYLDRLEPVDIPTDFRFDRPEDKVTGVVDRNTRRLIGYWLANRLRCPVVIEAMVVSAGKPTGVAPGEGKGNLWHHTEPGYAPSGVWREYATDFTGRFTVPEADSVAQPPSTDPAAGEDKRPRLVILSGWSDDLKPRPLAQSVVPEDPDAGPITVPEIRVQVDGGQWSRPETMWKRLEMKPETMLTGNPTVADLVSAIATPTGTTPEEREAARLVGRRRLSTYKVVRAVAEVEAIGFFDGINGYDNAFLSMGPCHWTMGKFKPQPPTPALGVPGPHVIRVNKKWVVEAGEFWAFLALLEHLYPETFESHFGADGVRASKKWGQRGVWDAGGRKYVAYAMLPDDLAPRQLGAVVREYDYFHSWHSFYRMLMAVRTSDNVRRAMYRLTAQRICDGLAAEWPGAPTHLPSNPTPPPVPVPPDTVGADGVPRRPKVGEVITSEWGVALLHRWHVLSPSGLFNSAYAINELRFTYEFALNGQCRTCGEATRRGPVDPWSPNGGPRVGPDFTIDPADWGDAHEHAMVAGVVHRANYHDSSHMKNTINEVREWPQWYTDSSIKKDFKLEVDDLPVPGGSGVDPAVFPVSERQLKHERGSFLLDSEGLPYPESHTVPTPGGGS
ncbi:hypothetical protein [Saccharothrix yanglingensis]|uniref:Peptidoglycan binding-like domain-containing protein n=1 Tax=Saccharothrix yanglingensis TaxID=659496 RepID=A0ABU0X9J5_9PSEU|nr:hypothetical protein [Saccharothrix yanglingensis]MDQ2588803.1 hypothetical protein [Saccharothrix yanglingensis]